MLTPKEQARFNELRNRRSRGGTLTDEETAEVTVFSRRLEDAEAVYLAPATERLRQENEALSRHTAAVEALIAREQAFKERLERTLEEARVEQEALARERERLLAGAF